MKAVSKTPVCRTKPRPLFFRQMAEEVIMPSVCSAYTAFKEYSKTSRDFKEFVDEIDAGLRHPVKSKVSECRLVPEVCKGSPSMPGPV